MTNRERLIKDLEEKNVSANQKLACEACVFNNDDMCKIHTYDCEEAIGMWLDQEEEETEK